MILALMAKAAMDLWIQTIVGSRIWIYFLQPVHELIKCQGLAYELIKATLGTLNHVSI